MSGFVICRSAVHRVLLRYPNQEARDGRHMKHAWDRWKMHTKLRSENTKGRGCFENLGVDEKITLKCIVTCTLIARQRLDKRIPTTHVETTIGLLLLGNRVVNMPSQQ
jgi:hypothetical protein